MEPRRTPCTQYTFLIDLFSFILPLLNELIVIVELCACYAMYIILNVSV